MSSPVNMIIAVKAMLNQIFSLADLGEETMNFKTNCEMLGTSDVIYDGTQEQSVELDYILPDYYPDIFRMINCRIVPRILSWNVSGDKVTYELCTTVKLLYCSENSGAVNCIEQKLSYSKTFDLGRTCENPEIRLTPKTDYCNCRVVNQRRIDLRGAVSIKMRAVCPSKQEAVCDAFGMNLQLKKRRISFISKKLYGNKRIEFSEEFDLGYSKPAISQIIRSEATVVSTDKKVITNKMIVKGDVNIRLLYSCKSGEDDSMESMQFTVPYSQVIDIDGVDEQFDCFADASVISCDVFPKENSDGENKMADCELSLMIFCEAFKTSEAEIAEDIYSTKYQCDFETSNVRIDALPIRISESHSVQTSASCQDGSIDTVHDAWAAIKNVTCRYNSEKNSMNIIGSVIFSVLARNDSKRPVCLETEAPFEHAINNVPEESTFIPDVSVTSCTYHLNAASSVDLKAEISIAGILCLSANTNIITGITCDECMPLDKEEDYALKLYFAEQAENIWDIAKKYHTSVDAVMEENDFSGDVIPERSMILIPIVQ